MSCGTPLDSSSQLAPAHDDYTLQPSNHYRTVATFLARGDHFSAVSMISPALVWSLQCLSGINDRVWHIVF